MPIARPLKELATGSGIWRSRWRGRVAVLALFWLLLTGCGLSGERPSGATATPARATATPEIGVTLATRVAPTAAVVQITPSPLPTATPTPTATPIIYVIEEGDTLLGVAIQRYTTVDEIKTLNPGINPNLLQIGQELVLPPPATPLFQASASTPIPIDVAVVAVHVYQTPLGSAWLLGEVVNRGEFAVENIQVQIDLLDQSGDSLGVVTAWVIPAVIPADGRAPFGLLLDESVADFAQPAAAVIAGETVRDLGSRYLELAVQDALVTIEESRIQLSGVVTNQGQSTAIDMILVATFYDLNGRITGYQQLALPDPLPAGESRSFQLDATPPGGEGVAVSIIVQALRTPEG